MAFPVCVTVVYRGCADPHVLPWGVTPAHQCTNQGPNKALWWFCIGNLCNFGEHPCGGKGKGGKKSSGGDDYMATNMTSAAPTTEATTEMKTTTTTTTASPTTEEEMGSKYMSHGYNGNQGTKATPYEKTTPPSHYNMYNMMYPFNYYEYNYKYDQDMQAPAMNESSEQSNEVETTGETTEEAADPYSIQLKYLLL